MWIHTATRPRLFLRRDPDAGWRLALYKLRIDFQVRFKPRKRRMAEDAALWRERL